MSSNKTMLKDQDFVDHVNACIHAFRESNLKDHLPLGPDYSFLDHQLATEALQLHRLVKKFEIPSDEHSTDRAADSIADVLAHDFAGLTSFEPGADKELSGLVRHILYNAKRTLNEALANYRFSISNLELTSGETFVSARGDTSVYAKLRDVKQWAVTADCFDLAAELVFQSPLLLHAAKRHFKAFLDSKVTAEIVYRLDGDPVKIGEYKRWLHQMYHEKLWDTAVKTAQSHSFKTQGAYDRFVGLENLKLKLKCFVTIQPGSRVTTVPKDNDKDRVILCECWLNMLVQRTIAGSIRKIIQDQYGIDLKKSQDLHGLLISDLQNVTIDLKNASNSVWFSVVKWLMERTKLLTHLTASRCGLIKVGDDLHRLNMLSPNGNGFTFEVLTLVLLCVARECDSFAHVYGDDIIIDADVAPQYLEVIEYMGFMVNTTKTFLNGNFRESCGSFFCEGYIISYDLHYAEDVVDAITLVNKIGLMAYATDSMLASLWLTLHKELLSKCPRNLLRGFRFNDVKHSNLKVLVPDLADGVFVHPAWLKKLRAQDPLWQQEHKNFLIDHMDLLCDLNLSPSRVSKYRYVKKRSVTYEDMDSSWFEKNIDASRLLGWFYVWAGRAIAPPLRETKLVSQFQIAVT